MLLQFIRLVLQLVPPLLWWVLGLLGFCLLNNIFHQELWPNTPAFRPFFVLLMSLCLMTLPWLAARLAWQLAEVVHNFFWKAIWRFAAVAGYGGAGLTLLGGLIAVGFIVAEIVEKLSQ